MASPCYGWLVAAAVAAVPGTSNALACPSGNEIFVGGTGSGGAGTEGNPFRAFSDAMACAAANKTIVILGAYNIDGGAALDKASITVMGRASGLTKPVVTCTRLSDGQQPEACLTVASDGITLANLTLSGGSKATVQVSSSAKKAVIRDNILRNTTPKGYGVYVPQGSAWNDGVQVTGNNVSSVETAILGYNLQNFRIDGNTVHDVTRGDGIVADGARYGQVNGNSVRNLSKRIEGKDPCSPAVSTGIKLRRATSMHIDGNVVEQVSGGGIVVRMDGGTESQDVSVTKNSVTGAVNYNKPETRPQGCDGGGWPSAVVMSHVNLVTVQENIVQQNWGEGIAINASTRATVEHNWVVDNFSAGIYLNNASDVSALRNFVSYTPGSAGMPYYRRDEPAIGIGMANEKQESSDPGNFRPLVNIAIASNIVRAGRAGISHFWSNTSEQKYHASGLSHVMVYNNTVYRDLAGTEGLIQIREIKDPIVSGGVPHEDIHFNANLFYQPTLLRMRSIPEALRPVVRYATNDWWGPGACPGNACDNSPSDLPAGDLSFDPLLGAPGGVVPENYTINYGSSARDAAAYTFMLIDRGRDYFGTLRDLRPDIGAHEAIAR